MHPATIGTTRTTTATAGEILGHTRRLLNHLHRSINNHSQTTPEDPHLIHWHYAEFGDNNFKIHGETLFYIFILFSIILFITLLLLYARWFFRFRHPSTAAAAAAGGGVPSTTVSLQHIVIQLPNRVLSHQRQPSGLEPSVINSLPIILHQSKGDEFSECCICLGGFEDGDKVKVLPNCKHEYHTECVDRWLISHSSCPLCRIAIRGDPTPTTAG